GPGATHQLGATCGDTVKGDGGGLQTAGYWAVGSPTRPLCGPVGELSGPPRREIYRTCAQRRRTKKLPEKSQQGLYKGLAATQSRVTWSNPRLTSDNLTRGRSRATAIRGRSGGWRQSAAGRCWAALLVSYSMSSRVAGSVS